MGKIRRKFEPEFKRQMVEQVETGQVTMAQAAREYQISRSLIERWRKQYRSNVSALADQPSRQERQLEAENEKLKAKIGDLVMQIEHLKKLQVWVRQRKSANTSAITSNNLDQFRKRANPREITLQFTGRTPNQISSVDVKRLRSLPEDTPSAILKQ